MRHYHDGAHMVELLSIQIQHEVSENEEELCEVQNVLEVCLFHELIVRMEGSYI